jgi:hypothetical protein
MAPRRSDRHAAAPAAPAPARDAPSSGDAVYINADEIPPAAWRRLNLTPRTGWVVGRVAEPVGDAAEPLDSLAMLEVLLKVDVADDGVKLARLPLSATASLDAWRRDKPDDVAPDLAALELRDGEGDDESVARLLDALYPVGHRGTPGVITLCKTSKL